MLARFKPTPRRARPSGPWWCVLLPALVAGRTEAGIVVPPGDEDGVTLFSLDRNADRLVTIDPETGQVTDVGAVGWDIADADLTIHNGRLYAVNTNQGGVQLLELDMLSGAALSVVPVTAPGGAVLLAEGLTSTGGGLLIGYSSAGSSFLSNAVGQLGLDGSISAPVNLAPLNANADLDGLGFDPARGRVTSVDVRPNDQTITFYDLGPDATRYGLIHQLAKTDPTLSVNDLVFAGSIFYGLDDLSDRVHRFDAATGRWISSVPLQGGSDLRGLAMLVPGPGGLTLLVPGLALGRRRPRRA
jgi:hypothetical protein